MWKFEVYKDEDHSWRWRLVRKDALVVAESIRGFKRRADAETAAEAARDEIGSASVVVV